jgi:hypothetical protein
MTMAVGTSVAEPIRFGSPKLCAVVLDREALIRTAFIFIVYIVTLLSSACVFCQPVFAVLQTLPKICRSRFQR